LIQKHNVLDELRERYARSKAEIQAKLVEFTLIPRDEYFYELCFCVCTPQSKARHALRVVEILKSRNFIADPFDAADVLGQKEHYIRFHNQKALNLLAVQSRWSEIEVQILRESSVEEKRDWLAANLRGIGMKEAAHFLRNIGIFGVAILDRHILKHLLEVQVIDEYPESMTRKDYLEIETKWKLFCEKVGMSMEEMDLLFWSMETGEILK